jgi:CheY-like chemotaxis protein
MMHDGHVGDAAPGMSLASVAVLGRMRHDLRTPLNAIIGYSEMLLEDADRDGRAAIMDDVERVRQGGLRLLSLINEVLHPSPSDTGEPDLEAVRRAVCERLRPPLDAVIGSTNALLEKAESTGLVQSISDVRRIRDAGLRLLSLVEGDALAAMDALPGPERAAAVDAGVPRIDDVSSSPAVQAQPPVIRHATSARLLVVDDHEANRDILSRYLQRHGHRVTTASGGRQALGLLAASPFDLVLLDIVMPDMNGYQVLQQLKAEQSLSQIPVIFISALDDALGKVQAFRAGGVDYVTKPFQADEVIARVENQLKISRLQKDLGRQNKELLEKNEELMRAQKRTELVFSALAEALPGTVLDGKYRLEEKIGAGGFGAVFRGVHLGLDLPVAIKVFRPLPGNDTPDALERFRQEGVAASRIKHPNVVEVHDNGISSTGIAFLVMELLHGRTLAAELSHACRLTAQRAVEILVPVCETLAEFHGAGIVHRDIKPENIYLHQGRSGEVVKLLDFGLSKIWGPEGDQTQLTMTLGDVVIGTITYMAPERLLNKPYDGRSDVYSLGVVAYKMLCGTSPFQAEEGAKYAMAIRQLLEDPPPISVHNPDLPPGLGQLVARMLSRDPSLRPSARQLSGLLAAAVS